MDDTRYKVLFIEDDKVDQMAFERLVEEEKLSYDYVIAGSVSQAQNILSRNRFDVVIADYLLGDGTAFEILDSIRESPVIFATGLGDEEVAVKAMKAGACDYLIKDPAFNYLKVLPEVIKNAVSHKRAEQELKKYHDNLEAVVKERTAELAAEKELLAVTLSSMADAVIVVDAEKRVMLLNKVAEELTGWKFEDARGKPVDEVFRVIDEQTKKTVESPIDKVLISGNTEAGSGRDALIARDGGECPISATVAPIHKNSDTMIGIVIVVRDVSREREIDRMKTDFVSSVSHEFRTPLASIKAFIATILRDPNMPEQTKGEFLTIIDEESNRLADLLEDLLEISRIESGTAKIAREPVDVAAVIEQALSVLQPLANEKNIYLQTDISDGLPELQGDNNKVRSAVTNLVNNAIKFTPGQGRVSVSVWHKAKSCSYVLATREWGYLKRHFRRYLTGSTVYIGPASKFRARGWDLPLLKKS